LSCWMSNPWMSSTASGLSMDHFIFSAQVSCAIWLPAFTDTSKGLFTCVHDIVGVAHVIAIECCGDSLLECLWEWGGVFWADTQLGYLDGWGKCCRYAGEWSRTLNARLLDFACSFHTSLYWHGLLHHHSSSRLRTLSVRHLGCCVCVRARAMHARTRAHTQKACSVFKKRVKMTYTRNFLTWWNTSRNVFLIFSCLGKRNHQLLFIYNIVTPDEQCLLPHSTYPALHFLWDITFIFFFLLRLFRHNYRTNMTILKTVKSTGEVHSVWHDAQKR
jgi:hypothetical protein